MSKNALSWLKMPKNVEYAQNNKKCPKMSNMPKMPKKKRSKNA